MAKAQAAPEKKKREFPDVYALVFLMCIVAMIATWIVPAGSFERVTEGTLTKVVPGSFQYIDRVPQTPWDMLQAIFQGCINSAGTIFMIIFCGAAVNMLDESKALTAAFSTMARKLRGKEAIAIAAVMFALGLGNAAGVFGNLGTAIILIGVFMARAMGGQRCPATPSWASSSSTGASSPASPSALPTPVSWAWPRPWRRFPSSPAWVPASSAAC